MGAWIPALAAVLLCACASRPDPHPTEGVPLNQAVREAAAHVEKQLPPETKLALLNFNSPTEAFSRYVLDEMAAIFVANGRLVIVDRTDIDLIRNETGFQLSGEVSDESAQSIGKMLGAQSILSGSLTELDGVYRFTVKVLNVETARVEALFPQDLLPDSRAGALLGSAGPARAAPSQTASPQTRPQQQSVQQPVAAPPPVAAQPGSAVPAAPVENYPPELDSRLAELAALSAATDAAALIEQRSAWAALLQYIETHYREHPEFAVSYDPSFVQENINYDRGTVTVKAAVRTTPLPGYQKAVSSVKAALDKTGQSRQWGWGNWPAGSKYFTNEGDIFLNLYGSPIIDSSNRMRQYARNNFLTGELHANSASGGPKFYGKNIPARAALLKADGEVIAVSDEKLCYVTGYSVPGKGFVFAPAPLAVWFRFSGVKASDMSGGAAFKIISIDNVVLDSKDGDYVRISTENINTG
jgi:hypothetical protein